jgi:magnesium chelatase subunit I
MDDSYPSLPASDDQDHPNVTSVHSLRELIDMVSGRNFTANLPQEDMGLAEPLPFPFLAIVGQTEMKLALLLAVINPMIGGVALIGPRGTAKTTAVRSLLDLLPDTEHSLCFYGCLPEDVETGGIDAVCPECAKKYARGEPLTRKERVRLVELPLNARLEDVIGGLDERAALHSRMLLRRGILSHADKNILFIDEVNLLSNEIINAILDASATGIYTVRRGVITATYRSRFILIGSMNPEEGQLRSQIMDRFGLRIIVPGLSDPQERQEAYRRVSAYRRNPRGTIAQYANDTAQANQEIIAARNLLPKVTIPDHIIKIALDMISQLKIASLRAEITLFEAARACAAADNRSEVSADDLRIVAPLALRLRQSTFINQYLEAQAEEQHHINTIINTLLPKQESK